MVLFDEMADRGGHFSAIPSHNQHLANGPIMVLVYALYSMDSPSRVVFVCSSLQRHKQPRLKTKVVKLSPIHIATQICTRCVQQRENTRRSRNAVNDNKQYHIPVEILP